MAWLKLYDAGIGHLSLKICQPCCTYDYCIRRWVADSSSNYYDVLGLKPNATQSQIKTAYYQRSKLYHPDTANNVPNAKEKFANLSEAYDVLGNPQKRALYDRKHNPASSFRRVGDNDIEYREFLRRRGTFSPRNTAHGTPMTSARFDYDEFYKQRYEKILRYNWEVKKSSNFRQQKINQNPMQEDVGASPFISIAVIAFSVAFFVYNFVE